MSDVIVVTTADARNRFSDFVNRVSVQKEWILLTRRGKPIAGAVPLEDFLYFEGPEGSFDVQGIESFDNIMTREERIRVERIGEASVSYQVDNSIRRVSSADLRNNLADTLSRVCFGQERIIVTRREWDLFALVPPHVFEKYVETEELEDELDAKAAEEALTEEQLGGLVSWDEFKKELELD
jgi:prevent-host-death family protein